MEPDERFEPDVSMRRKSSRRLGLAILVVGVLVFLGTAIVLVRNAPPPQLHPDGRPVRTPVAELPDPAKAKPELSLTVQQFEAQFNPGFAAKWKDKLLEVSGPVYGFAHSWESGDSSIFLDAGPRNVPHIKPFVEVDLAEPWTVVAPGQQVVLRGFLRDEELGVANLIGAKIVDKGPSPVIVTTAERLTKQFADERGGAEKKLLRKPLIVEGKILRVDRGSVLGGPDIILAGSGSAEVRLATLVPLLPGTAQRIGLVPGATIQALGICEGVENKGVKLEKAWPIFKNRVPVPAAEVDAAPPK